MLFYKSLIIRQITYINCINEVISTEKNYTQMIKKIFIKALIIIFSLFVIMSVYLQSDLEKYKSKQIEKYNILQNRKRIKYTPGVIYYLSRKEINFKSGLLPYWECSGSFGSKRIYDEYILECYYTLEEKLNYLKDINYKKQ